MAAYQRFTIGLGDCDRGISSLPQPFRTEQCYYLSTAPGSLVWHVNASSDQYDASARKRRSMQHWQRSWLPDERPEVYKTGRSPANLRGIKVSSKNKYSHKFEKFGPSHSFLQRPRKTSRKELQAQIDREPRANTYSRKNAFAHCFMLLERPLRTPQMPKNHLRQSAGLSLISQSSDRASSALGSLDLSIVRCVSSFSSVTQVSQGLWSKRNSTPTLE